LADADVASYGRPHEKPAAPPRKLAIDPVWNRTRAVYESKTSLLAAAGTSYVFDLPPVADGELRFDVATPPNGGAVELAIEADGKMVWSREITPLDSGAWTHAAVPLKGAKQLALRCIGDSGAMVVWGQPILIEHKAEVPKNNVVLIIIDTLRRDALPAM